MKDNETQFPTVVWVKHIFTRVDGELAEHTHLIDPETGTHAIRKDLPRADVYDAGFSAGWCAAMRHLGLEQESE